MAEPMSDASGVHARLEALEMHVAHQAQVIDDLNASVASQWATIDGLRRRLGELGDRLEESEARAGLPQAQRPPHY